MSPLLVAASTAKQTDALLAPLISVFWHGVPIFLFLGLLVVGVHVFKHPSVKGVVGETLVNWVGLSRLDNGRYRSLKNVFIPTVAGDGVTELDHVVVSAHGIFVIETKNYSGWIFGNEHDRMWTRTNYGNKCQFVNPLRQNDGHVNALAAFLGLPRSKFHSVVFFVGEATLKTPMPGNVLTSGLSRYIESNRDILLSESQVDTTWARLSAHDRAMDKRTVRREHVARVSRASNFEA